MKTIYHSADKRGVAEHGWLHSRFSFSFAEYYDPDKMGFGLLRVLNDDTIEGHEGFGMHPHKNMEIITIMLEGELEHRDSMGSGSVIKPGEVQVMSAGSGVFHSEMNPGNVPAKLLQIWIITKELNIEPRYDQRFFGKVTDGIKTVVSGKESKDTLYIHQNASISIGKAQSGEEVKYKIQFPHNGVYLFVLEGSVKFDSNELSARDAVGIYDTDEISFNALADTRFVLIDVPMHN